MYRPMDIEVDLLIRNIKLYNTFDFTIDSARREMRDDILKKWATFLRIPIAEFSHAKWDKLNDLMNDFI